mmetsp:Transcript_59058/g.141050  ORF Transcript_59058/g.141050 Transcript_59058/m.141050 type:complete len:319 (-) Transcript_59058:5-961(-)
MTVWPFQQVVCYSTSLKQYFIAPRFSAAYVLWWLSAAVLIVVPLFGVFASDNVWVKESAYREQPAVRFAHDVFVTTTGSKSGDVAGWTNLASLQPLLPSNVQVPALRVSSADNNHDGLSDSISVDIDLPLGGVDNGVQRVLLLCTFVYELRERVRTSMTGMVALDLSAPYPATGVQVLGELALKQSAPLRVHSDLRDVYISSPLEWTGSDSWEALNQPLRIPSLLARYAERNETLQLNQVAPVMWDYAPRDSFHVRLQAKVPPQLIQYTPGVLEALKFAWMQFAALLVPTWLVVSCVLTYAFERQIVETNVVSQPRSR